MNNRHWRLWLGALVVAAILIGFAELFFARAYLSTKETSEACCIKHVLLVECVQGKVCQLKEWSENCGGGNE